MATDEASRGQTRAQPVPVTFTAKAVAVWISITVAALLALALVYLALDAITWILVAALFAMALNPAVDDLVRRGLPRGPAAGVVFVVAFAALALLGLLVIPPLVTATTDFVEALPGYLRELEAGRGPFAFLERRFGLGERLVEVYDPEGSQACSGSSVPGQEWPVPLRTRHSP